MLYASCGVDEDAKRKLMMVQKNVLARFQARLDRIDMDLQMRRKMDEKLSAQHDQAIKEGALDAANKVLNTTNYARKEQEEGIQTNTVEVYALMEEINQAQADHDKQDPKERERSFAVAW